MKTESGMLIEFTEDDKELQLYVSASEINPRKGGYVNVGLIYRVTPAELRKLAAELTAKADELDFKLKKDDIWPEIPTPEPITTKVRELNPDAWKD